MVRVMRLPEVREATGLSETTIWRYERAGNFPQRRQIGPNAVGWLSTEIEEFIETRPAVELAANGGAGGTDR